MTQQTYKADDTLIATVNTSYHPSGQPAASWGTNTNPTFRLYDIEGRLVELRTFRSNNLALAPTASTPDYDKTTWSYESATGLLLAKKDAEDKSVTYTYYDDGKLYTRTWARGVVTTYGYDSANRLVSTNYSDTTPDVTMTYDRLNRQSSVSNGIAKSEFSYNPATLLADTETISYNLYGQSDFEFSRVIDRSQDTLGRDIGFSMGSAGVPPASADVQASYAYNPTTARLSSISNPLIPNVSFDYSYVASSSFVETVTGPIHTVTNAYEANRNVLASKHNKVGTETISKFDYSVNALGQRVSVATSGTAFPAVPGWIWGYDVLGQVTSANHSVVNNYDRAYQYDTIGNRIESVDGATTVTGTPNYTTNALNQYTAVTLGSAAVSPTNDDDANMTSGPLPTDIDSASTLTWDAENRLISATVDTATVNYLYDAQSRLISRSVGTLSTAYLYDAWNRIAEYQQDGTGHILKTSYLWGMDLSGNMQGAGGVGGLLLLTDHSATGDSSYFPTFDGNGNISEYLDDEGAIKAHFEYDPFGKTLPATPLASEDATLKDTLDYRFSTKPIDSVTGLFYYGYRWFDPATGRWQSRDPYKEKGSRLLTLHLTTNSILGIAGSNDYGFTFNNPLSSIDADGRAVPFIWWIVFLSLSIPHDHYDPGITYDPYTAVQETFRHSAYSPMGTREKMISSYHSIETEESILEFPSYKCPGCCTKYRTTFEYDVFKSYWQKYDLILLYNVSFTVRSSDAAAYVANLARVAAVADINDRLDDHITDRWDAAILAADLATAGIGFTTSTSIIGDIRVVEDIRGYEPELRVQRYLKDYRHEKIGDCLPCEKSK